MSKDFEYYAVRSRSYEEKELFINAAHILDGLQSLDKKPFLWVKSNCYPGQIPAGFYYRQIREDKETSFVNLLYQFYQRNYK